MTDAKRHFTPGLWGRCGRAIPDPQAAQMEDDTSYHVETLNQGRDANNPVPKFSMYAGKPVEALRPSRRMSPMKRMLAAAIGSWLAFAVLVWGAYVNTHGG